SGALSFEAISRGAGQVLSIEKDFSAFQSLEKNLKKLKSDNLQVIYSDTLDFLDKKPTQTFDFFLLDPPFHQKILEKTLKKLSIGGFLITGCKIYIESEFEIMHNFLNQEISQKIKINQQKRSGQVHYCLIEVL
ncbi:MAG: RsmD family RNA methyltransferase, partial [Proteobacteria bacterium]|nr:RsmD family RNA methyltransferase [Pseudomonadota bacterium]